MGNTMRRIRKPERRTFGAARTRSTWVALAVMLAAAGVSAHVGSPDVYFEGDAGPYRLYVTVRVPQVIPGIAEIEVRSASAEVQKVEIVPMRLSGAGSNLPPTPDVAERSKQDPQFFSGKLWLMEFGALKVRVDVEGSKGKGELSVPVPAVAQKNLPMEKSLGGLLFGLMLFLAVGLVFIAGAAAREGNLDPGQEPTPAKKRRARIVMAVTAVVVFGVIFLGDAWWGAEARSYARGIEYFKPPVAETQLENGSRLVIRAKAPDERWARNVKMEELVPDHGHLMHLFLVSTPGMERIWHFHPKRTGEAFVDDLPNMPAGKYEVFADIVDKNGFPWTLVGQVDLPVVNGKALSGDDSNWEGAAIGAAASGNDSNIAKLEDGGSLVWDKPSGPIVANMALDLKFKILDKEGRPARDVEPYMGMAGHAEIVSSDWSVFAHIHPAGSVSMAALELANGGIAGEGGGMPSGMAGMAMPAGPLEPEVSFPYGFPKAGEYRIFVQVKCGGQVQTGVFDTHVQ
jgi:extradiol dioxygenase family protein